MADEIAPRRKYELRKRAVEMAATRQRITEAAIALHGSIGPARTTMSAVAAHAGVQRHTVYRHFPDEAALMGACSAHYMATNPWPDLETWRAVAEPRARLERALGDLYAYYERNEAMLRNVLRDLELVDALQPTVVPLRDYLAEAVEILAAGRPARGRRRRMLDAALHHALGFHSWRSLAGGDRITRAEAVRLATALVDAAAPPGRAAA